MKRIALTILTSVYLPACAGEVSGGSYSVGDAGSSEHSGSYGNVDGGSEQSSTAARSSTAPSPSGTANSTAVASSTFGSDERSSSTGDGATFDGSGANASTNTLGSGSSEDGSSLPGSSFGEPSSTGVQTTATETSSQPTSPFTDEQDTSSDQTSDSSDDEPIESAFDIDLRFLDDSESSQAVIESFERAEAFWEELIVGDLPDIDIGSRPQPCNGPETYVEGTVDDLQIFVAVGVMDGPDGVLGAAGPCLGRPTFQGGLPLAGFMQFDVEDLERYAEQGRLDEVIIHEMGHVLGFGGVLWEEQGYLADASDENIARDTHFTGEKAIAEFDAVGGNAYSDNKVPVENTGGQGTANGHWREDVMGNEMMTSYMTNLEAVLSTVTLAALEDMGYEVDYTKAGGYEWPPPDERTHLFSLRSEPALPPIDLGDDILDIPFVTLD